jgi:hypothetical protein
MGAEDSPRRRRDHEDGCDECQIIQFDTVLFSPDPAVLAELAVGGKLSVEVQREGGAPTVSAFDEQGRRAGSISAGNLPRLVICIEDGNRYFADVIKVEGAECRVRVHHELRS